MVISLTDNLKPTINVDVDGNKIYDDAIAPIAHPTAQTLGLVPRAIKAAFSSLEKWILNREYSIRETEMLLEKKLESIDPHKIVAPEPYIAVPAIQAISYSMDNQEIRDMYASLLAKAMNSDFKDDVHPACADIIKQLSPSDAQFFRYLSDASQIPICKVRHQHRIVDLDTLAVFNGDNNDADNSSPFTDLEYFGKDLASDFVIEKIDDLSNQQISLSLSNLTRLGMISINYGSVMDETKYESFTELPQIQVLLDLYPNDNETETVLVMGTCELTTLGKQFASICLE